MIKILILSCLCLVILYLDNADAQNRPRAPTQPPRRAQKQPPARVLNKVLPKTHTRQQQQKIKQRTQLKKTSKIVGIKPARVRGYQDNDWCVEEPNGVFLHDDCDKYWYCDEDDNILEYWCPEDTPVFDYEFFECMTEEEGICWQSVEGSDCPQDPSEVAFFPGETCEDYFICFNGAPVSFWCAPGLHWDDYYQHCDTPANAQCDPSAEPGPSILPDCHDISGTIPHPTDCRLFIFCQKNGSRMIQQCPHLMAYDINRNQCVVEYMASCATPFKKG